MSGKYAPGSFETTSDTSSNSSLRRGLKRAYDAVACRYSDPVLGKRGSMQQGESLGDSDGSEKGTFDDEGSSPSGSGEECSSKSSSLKESSNKSSTDERESSKGSNDEGSSSNKTSDDEGSSERDSERDFQTRDERQVRVVTSSDNGYQDSSSGESKSKRTASTQSETESSQSHHPQDFSTTLLDLARSTQGISSSKSRSRSKQSHKRYKTFKGPSSVERTTSPDESPDESPAVSSTVNQGPVVASSLPSFLPQQHLSNIGYPSTLIGTNIAVPTHGANSSDLNSLFCHPLGLGGLPARPSSVLSADDAEAQLKQKHLRQQQALVMQQHLELHQLRRLIANPSLPQTGSLTPPVVTSRFHPDAPARVTSGSQPSETNSMVQGAEGKTLSMYVPTDEEVLSDFQILLRKNLEYFEAGQEEVEIAVPGRRVQLVLGQVGIRCRFCRTLPVSQRAAGTVYFPTKIHRLYQSAQNIATTHFFKSCSIIDPELRTRLASYQNGRSKTNTGHAGKEYWSNSARALGITETPAGLRFDKNS